jgi:hypothetical protein
MGFQVDMVTNIGFDFPDELVPVARFLGINCDKKSDFPITRFVLDYRYEPRRMMVPTVCETIKVS